MKTVSIEEIQIKNSRYKVLERALNILLDKNIKVNIEKDVGYTDNDYITISIEE